LGSADQCGSRATGLSCIIDQHQHPRDAYLWLLGVDPDARGRGLGRRVATAVVNAASAAGHRRLMLNTDNPDNLPIYGSLGFELLDRQPRRSGLVAHLMTRDI
jgi:ribosomal protein S18 acetylase RimI-like enzyme